MFLVRTETLAVSLQNSFSHPGQLLACREIDNISNCYSSEWAERKRRTKHFFLFNLKMNEQVMTSYQEAAIQSWPMELVLDIVLTLPGKRSKVAPALKLVNVSEKMVEGEWKKKTRGWHPPTTIQDDPVITSFILFLLFQKSAYVLPDGKYQTNIEKMHTHVKVLTSPGHFPGDPVNSFFTVSRQFPESVQDLPAGKYHTQPHKV